jgi:selenoprotein W-related protein
MGAVLPRFKTRFSEYRLVPASGGKFEVLVNGECLYSKLETGRFPETDEILERLETRLR